MMKDDLARLETIFTNKDGFTLDLQNAFIQNYQVEKTENMNLKAVQDEIASKKKLKDLHDDQTLNFVNEKAAKDIKSLREKLKQNEILSEEEQQRIKGYQDAIFIGLKKMHVDNEPFPDKEVAKKAFEQQLKTLTEKQYHPASSTTMLADKKNNDISVSYGFPPQYFGENGNIGLKEKDLNFNSISGHVIADQEKEKIHKIILEAENNIFQQFLNEKNYIFDKENNIWLNKDKKTMSIETIRQEYEQNTQFRTQEKLQANLNNISNTTYDGKYSFIVRFQPKPPANLNATKEIEINRDAQLSQPTHPPTHQ